ncbi:phage tail protein [Candidatus Pacearchaeota archaeon]|jgi:hypothetical protein|nr:phage tail protein [Candidatus Pacearchaeota archaeon]
MSYTKTVWREHSMDTTAKLTALDNLEEMYGSAVSYIDAITHAANYYTEAQAAAKYFTPANDGTGTGLICEKLDGYTADQIIAAGSPAGVICWWSGSEASIPSGWLLCNGLNGTPDLRDRFIVGAGSHYSKGDTGGADTVTTTGTITIAGHALTADEIPTHTHGSITDYYPSYPSYESSTSGGSVYASTIADNTNYTGYTGDGGSHTHSASWDGTDSQDKKPPYYAICAIMKS